jgi:hypothetical protein
MSDETTVQPQYDPPGGGGPGGGPAPAEDHRHRTVIVLSACIAALIAVIVVGAVLALRGRDSTVTLGQASSVGNASDQGAATGDTSSSVAGDTNGASGAGQSNGGGGAQTPGAPTGPTPTIVTFHTPDTIDCHNTDSPMFSASWTTTNATKTTISIDGPGIYKTYGANADESLPFNCSSSHSFTLTAFGAGGKTVTRKITLKPVNVRPPQTPDPGNQAPTTPTTTKAPTGNQGTTKTP